MLALPFIQPVSIPEADPMFVHPFNARSAYSNALDIAAQVGDHILGAREGLFVIDHPGQIPELGRDIFIERIPKGLEQGGLEPFRQAPSRKYVLPLNRHENTCRIEIAAKHQDMDMREIQEFRIPSMQDGHKPDLAADPFVARPESGQRLPNRLHQLVIEDRLILPGDKVEFGRDGKDQVEVGHIRKTPLRFFDPFFGAAIVALGTRAIPAGAPLHFNESTGRASLFYKPILFSAAFFKVE
jgi:hypothetical protein